MKKRHILVLSLIVVILTMSYASAVDNDTDVLNDENQDLISTNDLENDTISSSSEENETIGAIIENTSSDINVTNDRELLGLAENTNVLTSSGDSSYGAVASALSSNAYKYPTKKQRTIKIGSFKAILTKTQYKKLFRATYIEDEYLENGYDNYYYIGETYRGFYVADPGLRYDIEVKTNKYIYVKVKIGYKYKIKRTRARMMISYGQGQFGVAYRYMAMLTHKYANPGYDYAKVLGKNAKYFKKGKTARYLKNLNNANLLSVYYIYNRYYQ